MTRSRLIVLGLALAVVLAWCGRGGAGGDGGGGGRAAAAAGSRARALPSLADALARAGERRGRVPWTPPQRLDGAVTIAGTVRDRERAVGGVEVVFRGVDGEASAIAGADGRYAIDVPIGTYRVFVRDDAVLSVGLGERVRLPAPPVADAAGAPDEARMPIVAARADTDGVDLQVVRGGTVRGRVVDRAGRAVVGAVVRASADYDRPALGTDIAESDGDGAFELRVAQGEYVLEVAHPRFAGVAAARREGVDPEGEGEGGGDGDGSASVTVAAGDTATVTLVLGAGCEIAGRVVGPRGAAGDGAIERQWGSDDQAFAPAGEIEPDGTFRWTTLEEGDVVLRAWPWKSPHSPSRRFACREGARFTGVVFELPDRAPDLDGVLVDAEGHPVANAYVDVRPADGLGMSQQERTDAEGRWGVYMMPAGRYTITAYARGRGVAGAVVAGPAHGVRLALAGTGRIAGRTPRIANGSITLEPAGCMGDAPMVFSPERYVVVVRDHAFVVEGVPACELFIVARDRGRAHRVTVTVPAGGTAELVLAIGPAPRKRVHGVVRDPSGRPAAGAVVSVVSPEPARAVTDAAGRYELDTVADAQLAVVLRSATGRAIAHLQVGSGGEPETLDVTLQPLAVEEGEILDVEGGEGDDAD